MKFAYSVPGYVCGQRFSQDSRYYDSTNLRFLDLAGYGNYAERIVGAPSFSNQGANNREGLKFDNSYQLWLDNPIAWEGSMLVVSKVHVPTFNKRLCSWMFGDDGTFSNNPEVGYFYGTPPTLTAAGQASTTSSTVNVTADAIIVAAFAWDQETRKIYSTLDGITVNESAAAAGAANGKAIAPGAWGNGGLAGTVGSRKIHIGDNARATGSTTVPDATDYWYGFEQHFWKGNVLRNNLPELKAFFDTLKAYYAVS